MTTNPLYNAFLAAGYIALIVTIMTSFVDKTDGPERGILVPLTVLSLFVLSAATMAYLFFYQPVMLYLEGKQKEAVNLFLKTVGVFACIVVVLLAVLFFSSSGL
ncbi:hypothetical protein HYW59_04235 [Candidatus Kaiserbacteria bacterium]|nr:hypothetical protein [Candidatus Kaiserbacteria bacterium]